jgi:hypothetical protein
MLEAIFRLFGTNHAENTFYIIAACLVRAAEQRARTTQKTPFFY